MIIYLKLELQSEGDITEAECAWSCDGIGAKQIYLTFSNPVALMRRCDMKDNIVGGEKIIYLGIGLGLEANDLVLVLRQMFGLCTGLETNVLVLVSVFTKMS